MLIFYVFATLWCPRGFSGSGCSELKPIFHICYTCIGFPKHYIYIFEEIYAFKHTCEDVKQFYLLLIKGLIFHQISGVFSEKACYAINCGGNPRFAKFTEPWLVKMTGSASPKEGCGQNGRWMMMVWRLEVGESWRKLILEEKFKICNLSLGLLLLLHIAH